MKKTNYPLKPTKKQLEVMKLFWAMLQQELHIFHNKTYQLEKAMSKQTGIEDLEFFISDDGFCGIGNYDRTLKLIQQEELEKR